MASVVGKTIFSDGKGKLFFGYYKDNDAVEFVDYKTWKKLSFKDVSKGDTNKERVIKAILKNQKQFNKKVDFNMWAKQKKRTFEETMDWFIQNGWINNINKGGIKESVDVLSVTEGKKVFKVNPGIGKVKYSISSHDGVKKHKDGSDFFDIETFKNKVDLEKAIKKYTSQGFKMESVNEVASRTAMEIGGLTGMNKDAIQKFVDDNNLDIEKVFQFVKKGKLKDRMELVSAIAGKPNNPVQKKMIKMFSESINEAKSYSNKFASWFTGTVLNNVKHPKYGNHKVTPEQIKIAPADYKNKLFKNIEQAVKRGDITPAMIKQNESVNEAVKPSQVRSVISKVKKDLMKKWKQKGGYENFGDKEGDMLRKKFNFNPYGSSEEREIAKMIQGFEDWAMNYDGNMREAKFGYKTSTASYINKHKDEYKVAEKMNKGNEMKFYDDLQAMEDKIGHPKTMLFISNALRGYGVDMYKDPKIKNPADAQEALFLLSK